MSPYVFVGVSLKKKPCLRSITDTHERNQDPIEFVGEHHVQPCPNQHPDSLSNNTESTQHRQGIHDAKCQLEQFKRNLDDNGNGNLAVNCENYGDNSDGKKLLGNIEQFDSENQLVSHVDFSDDKIGENKSKRDKRKDEKDKKLNRNKSGQPSDKQIIMGNAFGSSTKDTDGGTVVKTIDGSQFYIADQNLEHNNPEGPREPIVSLDHDTNQRHLRGVDGCQQQGGSHSRQLSGEGDDVGTSVDDADDHLKDEDVQKAGKECKNAQDFSSEDLKAKLKENKLLLVDKAYDAAEYIDEEPVPLSPIPEADIEVTPSPPPKSKPLDCNPSFEVESPTYPPLEETQQTTSQSPTTAYLQHSLPPMEQQQAEDKCKFLYNEETNKKQTETSKASNEDEYKSRKLEGVEVIADNSDQDAFKQVDEEISIKTTVNGDLTGNMEKNNTGSKTLTNSEEKREEEMEIGTNGTLKSDDSQSHTGQSDCIRDTHAAGMHKENTIASDDSTGTNKAGIIAHDNTIIQEYTSNDKQQGVQGSVSGQTSDRKDIKKAGLLEQNTSEDNDEEFEVLTDDTLDTSDTDMPAKSEDTSQKKGKKKSLSFRAIGSSLRSAFKGKSKSKSELPPGSASSDIGERLSQSPRTSTGQKLSTKPSDKGNEIEIHESNGKSTNLSKLSLNEAKVVLARQTDELPEVIVHEQANGSIGKTGNTKSGTEVASQQNGNASKHLDEPDAPTAQSDTSDEAPKTSAKRPPVSGSAWSRLQGTGLKKVAQDGAPDLSRSPSSGSLSSAASDDSLGKFPFSSF